MFKSIDINLKKINYVVKGVFESMYKYSLFKCIH